MPIALIGRHTGQTCLPCANTNMCTDQHSLTDQNSLTPTKTDTPSAPPKSPTTPTYNTNDRQTCHTGIHRLQQTLGTYIDPDRATTDQHSLKHIQTQKTDIPPLLHATTPPTSLLTSPTDGTSNEDLSDSRLPPTASPIGHIHHQRTNRANTL